MGVNGSPSDLAYTKFLFLSPHCFDDGTLRVCAPAAPRRGRRGTAINQWRGPRYSSPEMQSYMAKISACRRTGRVTSNAIIMPIRKRPDWWQQSALERVCKSLRDPLENPEWRFVEEGPIWRGNGSFAGSDRVFTALVRR